MALAKFPPQKLRFRAYLDVASRLPNPGHDDIITYRAAPYDTASTFQDFATLDELRMFVRRLNEPCRIWCTYTRQRGKVFPSGLLRWN